MSNIQVVGLGALNMDCLYQVDRVLENGETVVNKASFLPGGSAANTIYGLARLGVSTGFTGTVGDDAEGKALREDFRKVGVDTRQIKTKPGSKTGLVLCFSDKIGQRSLYVMPGANSLLTPDDIDLTYLNQTKILHVSSFADKKQFEILVELMDKLAPPVKVSFSPGVLHVTKGLKALKPILARTYILFINQDEIKHLTGENFITGAETCLKQGCHIVAVTLGKGIKLGAVTAAAYIRNAEKEYVVEPTIRNTAPAELDTTGAGDAFATGFLYGLLKGRGLEESGRLGDIVAQFSISKIGAREGLPTLKELAKRYQELYKKQL